MRHIHVWFRGSKCTYQNSMILTSVSVGEKLARRIGLPGVKYYSSQIVKQFRQSFCINKLRFSAFNSIFIFPKWLSFGKSHTRAWNTKRYFIKKKKSLSHFSLMVRYAQKNYILSFVLNYFQKRVTPVRSVVKLLVENTTVRGMKKMYIMGSIPGWENHFRQYFY